MRIIILPFFENYILPRLSAVNCSDHPGSLRKRVQGKQSVVVKNIGFAVRLPGFKVYPDLQLFFSPKLCDLRYAA